MATVRKMGDYDSPSSCCWYEDQVSLMQDLESPRPNIISRPYAPSYHHAQQQQQQQQHYPNCKQELEHLQYNINHHDAFLQLPQLESPKVPPHQSVPYGYDNSSSSNNASASFSQEQQHAMHLLYGDCTNNNNNDQVTDWRVLDKFVASQLSHDQDGGAGSKETNFSNSSNNNNNNGSKKMMGIIGHQEYDASTSTSSCHIMDLYVKIYSFYSC